MRYQAPRVENHGKRRRVRVYVTERQPDGSFRRVRKWGRALPDNERKRMEGKYTASGRSER